MLNARKTLHLQVFRYDMTTADGGEWHEPNREGTPILVKTMWAAVYPYRPTETDEAHVREFLSKCRLQTDWYGSLGITNDMYFQSFDATPRLFEIVSIMRDEVTRKDGMFLCIEKPFGV